MDCEVAEGPSNWKKRQEAVTKAISTVAKKSGSSIAEGIAKRKEADESNDVNCAVISQLCYEAQDQLRSGKMSLKEVVTELSDALLAMTDGEKKKA